MHNEYESASIIKVQIRIKRQIFCLEDSMVFKNNTYSRQKMYSHTRTHIVDNAFVQQLCVLRFWVCVLCVGASIVGVSSVVCVCAFVCARMLFLMYGVASCVWQGPCPGCGVRLWNLDAICSCLYDQDNHTYNTCKTV